MLITFPQKNIMYLSCKILMVKLKLDTSGLLSFINDIHSILLCSYNGSRILLLIVTYKPTVIWSRLKERSQLSISLELRSPSCWLWFKTTWFQTKTLAVIGLFQKSILYFIARVPRNPYLLTITVGLVTSRDLCVAFFLGTCNVKHSTGELPVSNFPLPWP